MAQEGSKVERPIPAGMAATTFEQPRVQAIAPAHVQTGSGEPPINSMSSPVVGHGEEKIWLQASSARPPLPRLNMSYESSRAVRLSEAQQTARSSHAFSHVNALDAYVPVQDTVSPSRFSAVPDRRSGYGYIPGGRPYTRSIMDGYTPGNPFRHSLQTLTEDTDSTSWDARTSTHIEEAPAPSIRPSAPSRKRVGVWKKITLAWNGYSVQAFNGILLFLPLLYFSRVTAIFTEVNSSGDALRNEIKKNIKKHQAAFAQNQRGDARTPGSTHMYWDTSDCPPEVENLKKLWNEFISAVTKEWETMNLIAVLLLSAIISSMQIGPVFANEIVRYIAFGALVSGLMSLIYSCTYIIRFSIMRPVHKAVEWAKEGEAAKTAVFWNVWIFLSIPAIWLSWALILFVAEIIAFLWLIDTPDSAKALTPRLRLAARVSISVILGTGVIYLGLILSTLKRYGTRMDETWRASIDRDQDAEQDEEIGISLEKAKERVFPTTNGHHQDFATIAHEETWVPPSTFASPLPQTPSAAIPPLFSETGYRRSPEPLDKAGDEVKPSEEFHRPVVVAKILYQGGHVEKTENLPEVICRRFGVAGERVWSLLVEEISSTWYRTRLDVAWQNMLHLLQTWNRERLKPRQLEVVLCWETGPPPEQKQHYVIYIVDLSFSSDLSAHFPFVPDGIKHCQVYDDTGALRLRLESSSTTEEHRAEEQDVPRPRRDRQRSKTSSSDGGTLAINIEPPSQHGSRESSLDYMSATEAPDEGSDSPPELGPSVELAKRPPLRVQSDKADSATPTTTRPRSAMRSPSSRSVESKKVRHMDGTPTVTATTAITKIPEASRTAEELDDTPTSGPGISPFLRRSLSHKFLYNHKSEIQGTYSPEELSTSATLIPTPTLVIWHKQIPYTLYIQKKPLITINDLWEQLGKAFQKPVPKNYLRGSEQDVVSRLRKASGKRTKAIKAGGQKDDHGLGADVICTADWIWSETLNISGFVEHPNGTWELETHES